MRIARKGSRRQRNQGLLWPTNERRWRLGWQEELTSVLAVQSPAWPEQEFGASLAAAAEGTNSAYAKKGESEGIP